MAEFTHEIVKNYREALLKDKRIKEKLFMPWDASIKPFPEQLAFLSDSNLTKLAKCGNRAGKTATCMRDLAWKLMRKHPYDEKFFCATDDEYMKDGGKIWWALAPTFKFIKEVEWEMYLKRYLPEWLYTYDDFTSGVTFRKDKGEEIIDSITFRNGDRLIFKTFSQDLKSLMGMSVNGGVFVDEMPPNLTILIELVTRTLDGEGCFTLGFTPVVQNDEIKDYVEAHTKMSVHQWGLIHNPVFRDCPEKLERVLEEWGSLPDAIKFMRMNGDWTYEVTGDRVFENVTPICVDDFEIPMHWRRVRVCDPANHRSGLSIYAEDPQDGTWFCIDALEIEWKGKLARTDDIEREIDKRAPFSEFRYHLSIYDNAEAWFGAHTEGKQGKWRPCVQKKKEALIMLTRDSIVSGRVKFFKHKAAGVIKQIYAYRRKSDGEIHKAKDHMVDTLQYFCREIPKWEPNKAPPEVQTQEQIVEGHFNKMKKEWAKRGIATSPKAAMSNRRQSVIALQRRSLR